MGWRIHPGTVGGERIPFHPKNTNTIRCALQSNAKGKFKFLQPINVFTWFLFELGFPHLSPKSPYYYNCTEQWLRKSRVQGNKSYHLSTYYMPVTSYSFKPPGMQQGWYCTLLVFYWENWGSKSPKKRNGVEKQIQVCQSQHIFSTQFTMFLLMSKLGNQRHLWYFSVSRQSCGLLLSKRSPSILCVLTLSCHLPALLLSVPDHRRHGNSSSTSTVCPCSGFAVLACNLWSAI